MTLTVRTLGPADHAVWRALRLEALERYPLCFLTRAEEQRARTEDQDRAMLEAGTWFGAFDGDEMIGQAALIPVRAEAARHRAEIGAFYITESRHGTPAAQVLLDTLVDLARDRGADQLELFVAQVNPRAIRFYERNGFARYGTLPRGIIVDGVTYDDDFMVRFLHHG